MEGNALPLLLLMKVQIARIILKLYTFEARHGELWQDVRFLLSSQGFLFFIFGRFLSGFHPFYCRLSNTRKYGSKRERHAAKDHGQESYLGCCSKD